MKIGGKICYIQMKMHSLMIKCSRQIDTSHIRSWCEYLFKVVLIFLSISCATLLSIQKHHHHEHDGKNQDISKHRHRNVYIYNKHYHIKQPTISQIHTVPNIQSFYDSHNLIHKEIPNTHYIPKVHWVDDDIHAHTTVLDHNDHTHTITESYPNDHSQHLTISGEMSNIAPSAGYLITPQMGINNY